MEPIHVLSLELIDYNFLSEKEKCLYRVCLFAKKEGPTISIIYGRL